MAAYGPSMKTHDVVVWKDDGSTPLTEFKIRIISNGVELEPLNLVLPRALSPSDWAEIQLMFKAAIRALSRLPVDNAITLDDDIDNDELDD